MNIVKLSDRPDLKGDVIDIFFESSAVQHFESDEAKAAFQAKWLDYYLDNEADNIFIGVDDNGQTLGYLTGCFNTKAAEAMYKDAGAYADFSEYYDEYPAHLHINVTAASRGSGVGAKLVSAFLEECRENGLKGAHLVTAKGARNVAFYERNGFKTVAEKNHNGNAVLFMGQKL